MIPKTRARELDRLRRAAHLSIAQVARLSGVNYEHVFHAVTGGGRISPDDADQVEYVIAQAEQAAQAAKAS